MNRSTISSLVQAAPGQLRKVVDRVLAIAGLPDPTKLVVDAIMGKVTAFAS